MKKLKHRPYVAVVVLRAFSGEGEAERKFAAALGVLGTAIGGVTIKEAECVAKTFPAFWDDLKGIGGKLEINAE